MAVAERTIPPAEPVESVVCGSLAVGGTSLAIAKAGATISRVPLYLHIALLKHDQVCVTFVTSFILSQLSKLFLNSEASSPS